MTKARHGTALLFTRDRRRCCPDNFGQRQSCSQSPETQQHLVGHSVSSTAGPHLSSVRPPRALKAEQVPLGYKLPGHFWAPRGLWPGQGSWGPPASHGLMCMVRVCSDDGGSLLRLGESWVFLPGLLGGVVLYCDLTASSLTGHQSGHLPMAVSLCQAQAGSWGTEAPEGCAEALRHGGQQAVASVSADTVALPTPVAPWRWVLRLPLWVRRPRQGG